jgi:hypothetical protein
MNAIQQSAIALITCSYGPDLHRCRRLCRSIDRWVSTEIEHVVIVPARDLEEFKVLESARRSVVTVEDTVPGSFYQLPMSERWWLDSAGWPVRGWIMQQITKLSANFATDREVIVFADSDLQFIRPLNPQQLLRNGALRLHRIPGAKDDGRHLHWHRRAGALLGLPRRYCGADYVGQLISWRRSNLEHMQQHIETVSGRPWYRGVARSLHVSEYVLYGAFVDGVLGPQHNGHFGTAEDLCHCCWFRDEAVALASGREPLSENSVAVLLQSNLGLSQAAEAEILTRIQPRTDLCAGSA